MTPKALMSFLKKLPGSQLSVQWGDDHVYKIAGKMFAVCNAQHTTLCFKAGEDSFHILTAIEGIVPAPYLARAKWVYLDRIDRLPIDELKAYVARSHALVAKGLTRKQRAEIGVA